MTYTGSILEVHSASNAHTLLAPVGLTPICHAWPQAWPNRVWRWVDLAPQTNIHTNIRTCVCTCISIYPDTYLNMLFVVHDSCVPNSLFLLDTGLFIWRTISCSARRSMSRSGAHYLRTQAPSPARPSHGQWPLAVAHSAATTPVRCSCAWAPAPRKVVNWVFRIRVSRRYRRTLSKECKWREYHDVCACVGVWL